METVNQRICRYSRGLLAFPGMTVFTKNTRNIFFFFPLNYPDSIYKKNQFLQPTKISRTPCRPKYPHIPSCWNPSGVWNTWNALRFYQKTTKSTASHKDPIFLNVIIRPPSCWNTHRCILFSLYALITFHSKQDHFCNLLQSVLAQNGT